MCVCVGVHVHVCANVVSLEAVVNVKCFFPTDPLVSLVLSHRHLSELRVHLFGGGRERDRKIGERNGTE